MKHLNCDENFYAFPAEAATVQNNSRSTSAFTLIELLTVIAIIGILASILIPVVGRVRESARVSHCQSQLRDLGIAVHLFAADNNDMTPPNFNPNLGGTPDINWGNFIQDRALGLLLGADRGGSLRSDQSGYLDNATQLYCPYTREEIFRQPGQQPPEDINENNRIVRAGYMWVYYPPTSPRGTARDNSKTTVDNPNRPYIFDFPLPGTAGLSAPFTINPHENRVNVWHVGGHVTSFDADELRRAGGQDALYDFMTSRNWDWRP